MITKCREVSRIPSRNVAKFRDWLAKITLLLFFRERYCTSREKRGVLYIYIYIYILYIYIYIYNPNLGLGLGLFDKNTFIKGSQSITRVTYLLYYIHRPIVATHQYYIYIYIYIYIHIYKHTHTHTHIYIYIYSTALYRRDVVVAQLRVQLSITTKIKKMIKNKFHK